jgi:molybdopterin-guanine dinucleotide biosynthesis protein A
MTLTLPILAGGKSNHMKSPKYLQVPRLSFVLDLVVDSVFNIKRFG